MRFFRDPELQDLRKKCRTISFYVFTVLIAVALFSLIIFNFTHFSSFLAALLSALSVIFYGIFIACVLFPFFTIFDKLLGLGMTKRIRLRETLALVLTYVFLALILGVILLAVLPSLGNEVTHFIDSFNKAIGDAHNLLSRHASLSFMRDALDNAADIFLSRFITPDKLISSATNLVSGTYSIVIGVIVSVYLLSARKKLGAITSKIALSILPRSVFARGIAVFRVSYHGFMEFFFARLILATILATLTYLFCFIIGIPFRGIIMLLLLLTDMVPFFGPIIGTAVCFSLVLLIDPSHALFLLLFVIAVRILEARLLKKKLLRPKLRPGAAVTAIAVIIGYALLGFVGALLAVPVQAAFSLILREFQIRHLLRKGYRIEDGTLVHDSDEEKTASEADQKAKGSTAEETPQKTL